MFPSPTRRTVLLGLLVTGLVSGCVPKQSGDGSGGEWTPNSGPGGPVADVELENGRYVPSAGAPPGFVLAIWGESVECGFIEESGWENPVLFVGIGTYYSGEYEIVPEQSSIADQTEPRARVGITSFDDSGGEESPVYPAISGTVRLESDVRNGGSPVDIRVDATFPDPLIAQESCQLSSGRPGSDAGGTGATCTCRRRDSDSTFECAAEGEDPSCCLDEKHWDSTTDFRRTLQARRCDGYGNLDDAGNP